MKVIGKIIGAILFFGGGLLILWFWFSTIIGWLGFVFGAIVAMVTSPGIVIFPFIFWVVEGVFPVFYFTLWIISIIGMVILAASSD